MKHWFLAERCNSVALKLCDPNFSRLFTVHLRHRQSGRQTDDRQQTATFGSKHLVIL